MKIGQLAKAVGCSVEAVRFYEKQGLLPETPRTEGNFRVYNEAHLQRLSFICYCRSLGISLPEIKLLLEVENSSEQQAKEIDLLLTKHIKAIAKRIHELDHLKIELIKIRQKCAELQGKNLIQMLFTQNNLKLRQIKK